MSMKSKFKVAALVVAVVVGMVLYKERFDRKEKEAKDAEEAKKKSAAAKADKNRWN